jgi:hypothetical protein
MNMYASLIVAPRVARFTRAFQPDQQITLHPGRAGAARELSLAVLITARYLVDRLRHPRARADDVAALRRRFAAAPGPDEESAEAIALAEELRRLREALSAALAGVTSCSGCAHGHPLPHGRWRGGHCCGTRTELVFTDDEVAALRLAGTTPSRLVPPAGDVAGCAFRGPQGCSLEVVDRPNICVRFVCLELQGELRERGDLREIKAIDAALIRAFERLRRLRAERAKVDVEPWEDG